MQEFSLHKYLDGLSKCSHDVSVIYAEDEDGIREQIWKFLARFFTDIRVASDGHEAFGLYMERPCDLLITDITMPKMTGLELCARVREQNFEQKIIVTSAHGEADKLIEVINLGVDKFVEKPIDSKQFIAKLYIVSREIFEHKEFEKQEETKVQELELLKRREKYHNNQQKDAFKKQMKIIRDEVSHRHSHGWFFDSYYKPLDILSGDTYGTIIVEDGMYLFYVIDAMGKGLAASVTSIQSTSFINNAIEIELKKNDFNFVSTILSFCAYIKKQILDDELLCVTFALMDTNTQKLSYANFGMPPILLEDSNGVITRLLPNNQPIMSFFSDNNVNEVDIDKMEKIIIYSDGLNEQIVNNGRVYEKYLESDFFSTDTLGNLIKIFSEQTSDLDDDLTVLYMRRDVFGESPEFAMKIGSTSSEVARAIREIEQYISNITDDIKQQASLVMSVNELLMNAYEHGNLGISSEYKQSLLMSGKYEERLMELENMIENENNTIDISIYVSHCLTNNKKLLKVDISDCGSGFDFASAIKIARFPFSSSLRGRGLRMSLDVTGGIYYNSKGKKATILDNIR